MEKVDDKSERHGKQMRIAYPAAREIEAGRCSAVPSGALGAVTRLAAGSPVCSYARELPCGRSSLRRRITKRMDCLAGVDRRCRGRRPLVLAGGADGGVLGRVDLSRPSGHHAQRGTLERGATGLPVHGGCVPHPGGAGAAGGPWEVAAQIAKQLAYMLACWWWWRMGSAGEEFALPEASDMPEVAWRVLARKLDQNKREVMA